MIWNILLSSSEFFHTGRAKNHHSDLDVIRTRDLWMTSSTLYASTHWATRPDGIFRNHMLVPSIPQYLRYSNVTIVGVLQLVELVIQRSRVRIPPRSERWLFALPVWKNSEERHLWSLNIPELQYSNNCSYFAQIVFCLCNYASFIILLHSSTILLNSLMILYINHLKSIKITN